MNELLEYLQRIEALAEAGLSFTSDFYDKERYEEIRELTNGLLERVSIKDISEECKTHVNTESRGYPTPKIDIRALIINEEKKILLVQDSHGKKWSLPGGFSDVGFSLTQNLYKEVEEETGLIVKSCKLLSIADTNIQNKENLPQHYYKFFFHCIVNEGVIRTSYETSKVEYFDIENLPELSLKRNTKNQIIDLYNQCLSDDAIQLQID